jgi:hypothetical protein
MSYYDQTRGNRFLSPLSPPKRKVFISSFHDDRAEVDAFIYQWSTLQQVFTAKALCSFDNDDFINSDNSEYVMAEIRRRYIGDASVTMVLVGTCTHSRRYVDWEIKSSLRRGEFVPNGLLAYALPSAMPKLNPLTGISTGWPHLPARLNANWNFDQQQSCYARYHPMPDSAAALRQQIENAFWDRTNRADLIRNDSDMMKYNAKCRACGVTH